MMQALCDNMPVQASAARWRSSCRIAGSVVARRACLILASCRALTGALLAMRVFRSWWTHPVPPNPATDGPLPADFFDSLLGAMILALLMTLLLAGLWAAATATGFGYLRSAGLTGRWRTAWACAVTAAAALGAAFIGVFLDPVPLFGQMVLGHPIWGLLAFSAAFLIVCAVMVAIIAAAAR